MWHLSGAEFGFSLLLCLAVSLGVLGVAMIFQRGGALKDRIRDVSSADAAAATPSAKPAERGLRPRLIALFAPIAKLAQPSGPDALANMRSRFIQAGWRGAHAATIFFGVKVMLVLVLPALLLVSLMLSEAALGAATSTAGAVLAGALGFYMPDWVVALRMKERRRRIFEAFPDAIDLIIVCIEAGLGLDMAIVRTGREVTSRCPELADEFALIEIELRMGATRERALRSFAARTAVEEISMFVAMMLQADRFGTSIADSLRVHAEELRIRRRLRAEEKAAKIPTKLLFPMMFCVFPALLLVLLGPAFIAIYRTLLPVIAGK